MAYFTVEFARGDVSYRVGGNGYVADVLVGIRKNGSAVLYDLKNIYEKEITDTSLAMASKNSQRSEDISVIDNNVSQLKGNVKIKLSLQETADASKTRAELFRENDNLRVANTVLKNSHGRSVSYNDAGKIARQRIMTKKKGLRKYPKTLLLARRKGLEPLTYWFVGMVFHTIEWLYIAIC